MSRLFSGFLAAGVLALAAAPNASAQGAALQTVFNDYKGDGQISPCAHSPGTLKAARGQIPPDIEQYAPDFPAALDAAIEERGRGACSPRERQEVPVAPVPTAPAPPPVAPQAPVTRVVVPPPPTPSGEGDATEVAATSPAPAIPAITTVRSTREAEAPPPALAISLLAGLLALSGGLVLLMRWRGIGERRLAPLRHAFAEAGHRAGATAAEFGDWLRLGR